MAAIGGFPGQDNSHELAVYQGAYAPAGEPMIFTRTLTSDPQDGIDYRTWWVADGPRMLALSVQHCRDGRPAFLPAFYPSVDVEGGTYVPDSVYQHEPSSDGDCRFHPGCEPSALDGIAKTVWAAAVGAGFTDEAVYEALESAYAVVLEEATR